MTNYPNLNIDQYEAAMIKANKFIDAALKEHTKLSKSIIRKQKYNLIKEIKKNYNVESFFSQRVNNYTTNASIYMLMEGASPSNTIKFRYKFLYLFHRFFV